MDRQAKAYREALPIDSWDGDAEHLVSCGTLTVRQPITDIGHVTPPEEYEAAGWDDGRERPKTIGEARAALLARIRAVGAPDSDNEWHAYDGDGI